MTTRPETFDENAFDARGICRDKKGVRVRLDLLDTELYKIELADDRFKKVQSQVVTDARQSAWDVETQYLRDAWKSPKSGVTGTPASPEMRGHAHPALSRTIETRDAAWNEQGRRLKDAWKNPDAFRNAAA